MEDKPEVIIYADGCSKGNAGPAAYGIVLLCPEKNSRKELSGFIGDNITNNVAELTAVLEALRALKRPCKVRLVSDSQYAILGMQKWLHGWVKNGWRTANGTPVKNQELWRLISSEASDHNVEWVWQRGHLDDSNNPDALENCRCDQLANEEIKKHEKGE